MLDKKPGELNQQLRRMKKSRDDLKEANRQKAQEIKALRDRNVEIKESRNMWKARCQEIQKSIEIQKEELKQELDAVHLAIEEERSLKEKESDCLSALHAELEELKKKIKI